MRRKRQRDSNHFRENIRAAGINIVRMLGVEDKERDRVLARQLFQKML